MVTKCLGKKASVFETLQKLMIYIFASFGNFLEKGFPQFLNVFRKDVRWASVSLLLMGIIFSNGQSITSIVSYLFPIPFTFSS